MKKKLTVSKQLRFSTFHNHGTRNSYYAKITVISINMCNIKWCIPIDQGKKNKLWTYTVHCNLQPSAHQIPPKIYTLSSSLKLAVQATAATPFTPNILHCSFTHSNDYSSPYAPAASGLLPRAAMDASSEAKARANTRATLTVAYIDTLLTL
jgi:hypothetical protein